MKTLNATGYAVPFNRPVNEALCAALNDAWRNFERDYGRAPAIDIMMFRGAFSTATVVFEIIEEA